MHLVSLILPYLESLSGRGVQGQFLLVLAFCTWLVTAVGCLFGGRRVNHTAAAIGLTSGGILLVAGALLSWNQPVAWALSKYIYFGLSPYALRYDAVCSLFLVLLGISTAAVGLFSPGYLKHLDGKFNGGLYWTCLFIFVISMGQTILAANAITFLVFWEAMALSSAALVLTDHSKHKTQRAGFIYLAATRVSTSLLLGAFLWMHRIFGSWNFQDWHFFSAHTIVPAFLAFVGLGIKAGIWPFHKWLPYAHPEAPAPVSALMSGVMVKVAIYGMVRMLLPADGFSLQLAYTAIVLGTISSAWGVLFSLMERDLKRLLAYSTVENVGLIVLGLGLAMYARSSPALSEVGSLALLAAVFHALNHGTFKTLLFLSAGAVDSSAHSRDMNILGGLGKRMPATMLFFLLGAISICAMPPLNGFSSKWLLYQSFLHLAATGGSLFSRATGIAIVGILSFVGALAVAAFTKAVGITFLGKPRSAAAEHATEVAPAMVAAQAMLCLLCVGFGVCTPYVTQALSVVCAAADSKYQAVALNIVPSSVLLVGGALLAAAVYLLVLRPSKPATFSTWDCGYGHLPASTEESATSFSRPIAMLFRPLLQYRVLSEISGRDRRHFPESITVEANFTSVLETYVYRPIVYGVQALSKLLVRMQTGSIHVHLLYVFVTLIVLICVGMRL